ncbi:hypothetical protein N9948_00355 [bacterium]|nr:hypothetical protein [bacterium]
MKKEFWAIIAMWVIIIFLIVTFKVWLFGSLITSSVKSMSNSCGTTYAVESIPVVSGNWFCNEKI